LGERSRYGGLTLAFGSRYGMLLWSRYAIGRRPRYANASTTVSQTLPSIPDSRFPIPDSRFPKIANSLFSY
ncbi:MAG: hypothetical protein F6J98_40330, partial [Moorea sp. SIO4G2]|nr:hypothetical protein [Moorena sp. SIO4G2]